MPFIGFLFNTRIGQIVGMLVLGSGIFFSWLAVHDHALMEEATNKFNAQQQELLAQKQKEFDEKTQIIADDEAKIAANMKEKEDNAKKQLEDIEKQAEADSTPPVVQPISSTTTPVPVSKPVLVTDDAVPYLKSIVKQLQNVYGEKTK